MVALSIATGPGVRRRSCRGRWTRASELTGTWNSHEDALRDVKNPRFRMRPQETRVGWTDRRDRMLPVGPMALSLLTWLGQPPACPPQTAMKSA